MIKSIFALLIFLAHSTFALECPQDTVQKQSEDGQSQLHTWCEKDGIRQGPYEVFALQGGLKVSANFKKGKLDGPFKRYHDNGKTAAEGNYQAGRMKGEWTRYWPTGRASDQGPWKNDKPVGVWKFFAEDGKFIKEKDFSEKPETEQALEDVYRIRIGFAHTDHDQKSNNGNTDADFLGLGGEMRLFQWARWLRTDLTARLLPERMQDSGDKVLSGQLGVSFDLLRRWTGPMAVYLRTGAHFADLDEDHFFAGFGLRYQPRRYQPGFRYGGLFVEYTHVDYDWYNYNQCTSGPCSGSGNNTNYGGESGLNFMFIGAFVSFY